MLLFTERSLDGVGRCRQESLSSVEEDDYDTLDDINSDKNIVRTKVATLSLISCNNVLSVAVLHLILL